MRTTKAERARVREGFGSCTFGGMTISDLTDDLDEAVRLLRDVLPFLEDAKILGYKIVSDIDAFLAEPKEPT